MRSRKLAFYRGRISSVGRALDCRERMDIGFDSQGQINTSILWVLKELRNEGTSNALQTAGRIMVVPSSTKSRKKNNVLNWCFRAKYIGTQIKWVFVCLFVFFFRTMLSRRVSGENALRHRSISVQ